MLIYVSESHPALLLYALPIIIGLICCDPPSQRLSKHPQITSFTQELYSQAFRRTIFIPIPRLSVFSIGKQRFCVNNRKHTNEYRANRHRGLWKYINEKTKHSELVTLCPSWLHYPYGQRIFRLLSFFLFFLHLSTTNVILRETRMSVIYFSIQ